MERHPSSALKTVSNRHQPLSCPGAWWFSRSHDAKYSTLNGRSVNTNISVAWSILVLPRQKHLACYNMCYLFTCVFRRVSTISRRNTSMYRYAFLKIGVKVISLNPCRKVAAYNFYVLLHFYKQFNREMISGAHLFLDDEDVVSARRKWFISSPFHLALTNSTCQKVAQCMTKRIPIWVHVYYPSVTFKVAS